MRQISDTEYAHLEQIAHERGYEIMMVKVGKNIGHVAFRKLGLPPANSARFTAEWSEPLQTYSQALYWITHADYNRKEHPMKIALIGSTRYKNNKMANTRDNLRQAGHDVRLPTFDGGAPNELALMDLNLALIKWADKVIVFWDGESKGTYGDVCMAYALDKPVSIGFLNPILFRNILIQLADRDASRN